MATSDDLDYSKNVDTLKNRVSVTKSGSGSKFFETMPKELRTLAFWVSDLEKLRTIEAVRLSLERAVEKGKSFKTWQSEFDAESFRRLSGARQELVFRTNMNNAYNQGTRLAAVENKDTTPYMLYSAINDSRVRPSHLELDGTIRRVDDPFWDSYTPPIGYNCRCSAIPIDKETANEIRREQGKSGYVTSKQELDAAKRRGGVPDKDFDVKSKSGNFTKGAIRSAERAIESLPSTSPYKSKFKQQVANINRKVAIWWESNKNIFTGD